MENNYFTLNNLNYTSIKSTEKYISSYFIENNSLKISFNDISFNDYINVFVFLENIKTNAVLECNFTINENILIIDLSDLNYLCTNYEYSLCILVEDVSYFKLISPKFDINLNEEKEFIFHNTNNINWFFRILQNGKLRLSSVYLFNNIDNSLN